MYSIQKDVNELSDILRSVMKEYIKPYREITRYWRKRIKEKTGIDDPGYMELLAETKTRSSLSMIDGSISEINPEYQI
ncbi:MAG: hypothetical protein J7K83_01280, partial [Candidatus Aenigmarchaeota archaeon]|nr:hypothetical protein [Candidatus Aenigmarchaeota archaeon]